MQLGVLLNQELDESEEISTCSEIHSKSFPAPPLALLALSAAGPSVLWGYQNSQVPAEKNITNQVR